MKVQQVTGEKFEQEHRTGPEPTLRTLIDEFDSHNQRTSIIEFTKTGSNSLTYAALVEKIRRVSVGFERLEIKNGNRVIVFAANSTSWIICALAAIYSGLVVVPVDPQQSPEVLKHIIEDSDAKLIFTDEGGVEKLEEALPKNKLPIYRIDSDQGMSSWTKLESRRKDYEKLLDNSNIPAENTAILFYTSGTTGMPKGVPLSHRNIRSQLDAAFDKMHFLGKADRILLPLPLFHVYPLNTGLLGPLKMGLPIILPQSLTGPELIRALTEGRATVLVSVPRIMRSLFDAMNKKAHASKISGTIFDTMLGVATACQQYTGVPVGKTIFKGVRNKLGPTLRLFTSGGAPLDPQLTRKFQALGWDIAIGYGLTETSPLLAMRMPENRDIEGTGEPIPNVEIKIIPIAKEEGDDDNKDSGKNEVAAVGRSAKSASEPEHNNNEGEVVVRGPNVFSGYLNLEEKTKEAFTEDGWFRTGDLGFIKDGNLHITGRASSTMVMEGGKKFQPDDVEEKIAKQSAIREIGLLKKENKLVALVVPDLKTTGEGDAKDAVSAALKSFASGAASYLRVTDFAVTREPLPRTNLGKLKRHELEEMYDKAKAAEKSGKRKGKLSESELSVEDRALLNDPAARSLWDWLNKRFSEHDLTLDTSPELELNIDSLEWMNLTLEMVETSGVEVDQEALSRVSTVRDLLKEVQASSKAGGQASSPIKHPERFLDEKTRVYVEPLTKKQEIEAQRYSRLASTLMKPFDVEAVGYENVPKGQVVFTPNHASYIDAFAMTASMPQERLRDTQWAGWVGIAFGNPVFTYLSRLAQVIPIDAKKSMLTSLALGAAVLKRGKSLVWFPEAMRTLDGNLLPFKQGIGILLKEQDIPVVPVYLDGTREALAPGSFFPTPTKIKVWYGKPVMPTELAKEGEGETPQERIANALRLRVFALQKQAMTAKGESTDELFLHDKDPEEEARERERAEKAAEAQKGSGEQKNESDEARSEAENAKGSENSEKSEKSSHRAA